MAKKKTFDVQKFRSYVNEQLARTDDFATQEFKAGICNAWHHVAHETGNYNGYNCLYWMQKGANEWDAMKIEWRKDFTTEESKEYWKLKNQYIYGNLGQYARVYF